MTLDGLLNAARKLRAAAGHPEFFAAWPHILGAESWAKLVAPTAPAAAQVLPRSVVVRMTERCFLHCKFCAQHGESARVDRRRVQRDFIGRDVLSKIGEEAAGWPIRPLIMLTGGEPLLVWRDLLDSVAEMRRLGLPVMFNTNGMLLRDPRIARRVVESDLGALSISLDGDRDTHNELRGDPRLFDAIMRGLDNLHAARKELGRKNPLIVVTMTVSSDTQREIERVYRIAVEKKADWFNIQFLNYTTPETAAEARAYAGERFGGIAAPWPWESFCNPRFNEIDAASVARQIESVLAMRAPVPVYVFGGLASSGDITRYFDTLEPIRRSICAVPFTAMHIVMPGKAVFCIDYPFYEYGDIREGGMKAAWQGALAERFRRDLTRRYREQGDNAPQCRRCCWRFT